MTTRAPYTREWHEENIERLTVELAKAVRMWDVRDREDPLTSRTYAGRIEWIARSLSAETGAIGALNYQELARRR